MAEDLNAVVEAVETLRAALLSGGSVLYAGRAGFALAPRRAPRRGRGGGSVAESMLQLVRVALDEDTADLTGSADEECGFLYFIAPAELDATVPENRLTGASLRPAARRDNIGEYMPAADNTLGLAVLDPLLQVPGEPPVWTLLVVYDEASLWEGCP